MNMNTNIYRHSLSVPYIEWSIYRHSLSVLYICSTYLHTHIELYKYEYIYRHSLNVLYLVLFIARSMNVYIYLCSYSYRPICVCIYIGHIYKTLKNVYI